MPAFEPYHTFAALLGYLLGSIPFGLVLTRMAGFGDIRKIGSGNIGATNVLRTGNKFLAFLTLTGDSGKGAAAAIVTTHFWSVEAGLIAGLMAVLGHNFPNSEASGMPLLVRVFAIDLWFRVTLGVVQLQEER